MDFIVCSGTPYQIGLRHGQLVEHKIRQCISNYKVLFMQSKGYNWEKVKELAALFLPHCKEHSADLVQEIQGIADGSGLDVLDILALNVRSEIALASFNDACTALFWKGEHAYLAQNWDWRKEQLQVLVHLTIHKPDSLVLHMITEAGIVGKIGCNSYSVGVTLNALKTETCDVTKIPVHFALRKILESHDKDSAGVALQKIGAASAAHVLIADADDAVGVELNTSSFGYLHPDTDGQIFHTNHLVACSLPDEKPEEYLVDTFDRLVRVKSLTKSSKHGPSFAKIREILCDTDGSPCSISRSTCEADPPPLQAETLYSIIMNLSEKRYQLQLGRPHLSDSVFSFYL